MTGEHPLFIMSACKAAFSQYTLISSRPITCYLENDAR